MVAWDMLTARFLHSRKPCSAGNREGMGEACGGWCGAVPRTVNAHESGQMRDLKMPPTQNLPTMRSRRGGTS